MNLNVSPLQVSSGKSHIVDPVQRCASTPPTPSASQRPALRRGSLTMEPRVPGQPPAGLKTARPPPLDVGAASATRRRGDTPPWGIKTPKTPRPRTPQKKDLWWLDDKMTQARKDYDSKFNQRLPKEAAYAAKMAKLKAQRERELIGPFFKKEKRKMQMQSGIESTFFELSTFIDNDVVCSLAEDIAIFAYGMFRSRSVADYVAAALSFVKARVSSETMKKVRAALVAFVSDTMQDAKKLMPKMMMQSGEEFFDTTREMLTYWPRFKSSPIWRKVNAVIAYSTALTFWGDEVSVAKARRIEESYYKHKGMVHMDFLHTILDFLHFIAERGSQMLKTRSIDPMFHSGASYEKWYDEAADIIGKSRFLANPDAHGIDIHGFLAKLDKLIAQGESMGKYACELDKASKGVVRGMNIKLLEVRATHINKKMAQKTRKAPLVLIVEGHSSIAKTTFANILHYYFGTVKGKNTELGSRYTRMAANEFWDGFTSDQWSLLIDDIASVKPGVEAGIDTSLSELLLINNNAPFTPNMAALEEKGAAPFLGDLVVATTNTPDLNLDHYFSNAGAVGRRFMYHIRIRPRLSLRKNEHMIDETKLEAIVAGEYPDWWTIEILVPVLERVSQDPALEFSMTSKLESLHQNLTMKEFLPWYHDVITKHTTTQTRVAQSEMALRATSICEVCFLPSGMCACKVPKPTAPTLEPINVPFDKCALCKRPEPECVCEDPVTEEQAFWEIDANDTEEPWTYRWARGVFTPYHLKLLFLNTVQGLVWLYFGILAQASHLFFSVALLFAVAYGERIMRVIHFVRTPHLTSRAALAMFTFMHREIGKMLEEQVTVAAEAVMEAAVVTRDALRDLGEKVQEQYFKRPGICRLVVSVLVGVLAVLVLRSKFSEPAMEQQGNVLDSVGQKPITEDEEENVWKHTPYVPSALDIGRCTTSWKNLDEDKLCEILARNCVLIRFKEEGRWKVARAFGVGGQFFVTTNHSLPSFEGEIEAHIIRGPESKGPSGNVYFRLSNTDVHRIPGKDLVMIKCRVVPPMKDITDILIRNRLTNYRARGFYYGRARDGSMLRRDVGGVYEAAYYNPHIKSQTQVWWGKSAEKTAQGECGSILITKSGSGPIIVGLHQLGAESGAVAAIKLSYEDVQELLGDWKIIGDSPPMLDAPSTNVGVPGDLHPKSPLNFMESGAIDGFGSFSGFRAAPKFRVERSIAADVLERKGLGFAVSHCAPLAKGWEPKFKALSKMGYVNPDVSPTILDACVEALVNDWKKVSPYWADQCSKTYDVHTAVNGVPGLKFVDGMKRNTSAGFPWGKPKELLLEQLEPTFEYPDHVKLCEEVEARIEEMLVRYHSGDIASPVFKTAFKNEPLPIGKAKAGKVRAFTMSCIEMTVIMRMYLLPFVRVAQSNHYIFEMAPGMEAQSCQWDGLRQFLIQLGKRCVAGDFKDYDVCAHPMFMAAAFEAIVMFLFWCKAPPEVLDIVRAIGLDVTFSYVDFFGDLVRMFGKNPSGQALTAIINSIMNSLYMRYAFALIYSIARLSEFQLLVKLITYGDDNAQNVSKDAPEYNHTSIQKALATIGVVYTMADKDAESRPYITLDEVSFLKRKFKYCEETGTYMAPLEMESINKMLMVSIPSSVVSPEVQMVDTIRSANSEYFFHGKEVFAQYHTVLDSVIDELNLRTFMTSRLETWEDLMERYISNSLRYLRTNEWPPFLKVDSYKFLDQEITPIKKVKLQSGSEPSDAEGSVWSDDESVEHEEGGLCVRCQEHYESVIRYDEGLLCCDCSEEFSVFKAAKTVAVLPPRPFRGRCPCGCGVENMGELRLCAHCDMPRVDEPDTDCYHCDLDDVCERCGVIVRERVVATALPSGYEPQVCKLCAALEFRARVLASRTGLAARSGNAVPNQSSADGANPPNRVMLSRMLVYARRRLAESLVTRPTIGVPSEHNEEHGGGPEARIDHSNSRPTNNLFEEFVLQSGVEYDSNPNTGADVMASSSSNTSTHETVTFVDGGAGDILRFGEANESAFTYDRQTSADLSAFLSRPKLISTITWTPGVLSNTDLDPWSLYLNTAEIKYKLNNFAFFRGRLRVKVVLNAAPFYYGALLLYYTPLPNSVGALSSTTGVKIQQSQRPHIWVLPQNNEGGEMTLPFMYPANYVALTSAAAVATLGKLTFTAYTQLASANGATSNGVQMQVYAWMEDVTLFGPTVGLAMQSGTEDEYGNGPVSAPAAYAAHWATYLSRVPYIGRFARATSIGASAVGQIAKLFGWSNVPVIEDVRPIKNVPFHDLASAHISEPTTKFLLDPKGELSVDPSLLGLGSEDELSVSFLVQKESYLATGTWTAGGAAGALIFSSVVSPMLGDRGTASAGGTYSVCLTPMSWVGSTFSNWRGDVIFRFKVICSKFHSGRLRIHWDPVSSLSATTDYSHVAYTAIIDLQESDEAEFRVPYMQALPWLTTTKPVDANVWSTTTPATPASSGNGTITLRVLNNLTAPVDTASCSVLVFVRGAENLEFANPRDLNLSTQLFSMQSGSEPITPNQPLDERYLVNWGEPVPSVRLLLRRSTLVDRITLPRSSVTTTDEAGMFRLYQSRLPPPPGYDPSAYTQAKGIETPATTYPYSFTNPTFLSWYASAFVAMRGSTRWHYNMVNPDGTIPHNITVTRRVGQVLSGGTQALECAYVSGAPSTSTSQSLLKGKMWYAFSGGPYGSSGTALTNPLTQTGVSVEMPMMTNYLFQFADPRDWLLGDSLDGSSLDNYSVEMEIHPASGVGLSRLQLHRYVAAGTDFTLHCFLNTPVVNYNPGAGAVPV